MSQESPIEPSAAEADPGIAKVQSYLLYAVSLPERALRSTGAVVGGALRESTSLLVPQAFQSSKTYNVLVKQMLDFMVEDVGGVERAADATVEPKVADFVARKTVGNFVDLAGLATLHLSPLLVLAVVSDVAYGSRVYLQELARELQTQGVIDDASTIHGVDDLLAAVSDTSRSAAGVFDTPPLSIEGLRQTIDETRSAVVRLDPTKILPKSEIARLWTDMSDIARDNHVSLFSVASAVTLYSFDKVAKLGQGGLSTARVAGRLFDKHLFEHYTAALTAIHAKGYYATLADTSLPYVDAVWQNFSTARTTITEDLLTGKLTGQAWQAVRRWCGWGKQAAADEACGNTAAPPPLE